MSTIETVDKFLEALCSASKNALEAHKQRLSTKDESWLSVLLERLKEVKQLQLAQFVVIIISFFVTEIVRNRSQRSLQNYFCICDNRILS
jgi:hypothetical protein